MAHPGRGKPGRPLNLDFAWPETAGEQVVTGTDDLPLFDWADQTETGELPATEQEAEG